MEFAKRERETQGCAVWTTSFCRRDVVVRGAASRQSQPPPPPPSSSSSSSPFHRRREGGSFNKNGSEFFFLMQLKFALAKMRFWRRCAKCPYYEPILFDAVSDGGCLLKDGTYIFRNICSFEMKIKGTKNSHRKCVAAMTAIAGGELPLFKIK